MCYFFVHKSLKKDNKKENDEIKQREIKINNQKIIFEMLMCI